MRATSTLPPPTPPLHARPASLASTHGTRCTDIASAEARNRQQAMGMASPRPGFDECCLVACVATQLVIANCQWRLNPPTDIPAAGVVGGVTAGVAAGTSTSGWPARTSSLADRLDSCLLLRRASASPSQATAPGGALRPDSPTVRTLWSCSGPHVRHSAAVVSEPGRTAAAAASRWGALRSIGGVCLLGWLCCSF